jgi:hypothetical protein
MTCLTCSCGLVVSAITRKDTYGVFSEPVDSSLVPDYYDVIKEPMDFGTMRKKINKGVYVTLNLFEVIPAPAVLPLLTLQ